MHHRYSRLIKLKYSNVTILHSVGEYKTKIFRFYIAMMGGFSVAWLALLWIANYFEDQGYAVVSIKKEQHSLIESFLKKKRKN